jgi:two-component system, OmpR family, response regulator
MRRGVYGRIMGMKRRILITEDDIDTVEMLKSFFTEQGDEVVGISQGEDVLTLIEQTMPDVVLLDVSLPTVSGFDICEEIRQKPLIKFIPVIFLTAKSDREDKMRGLELGADDYVVKPFDLHDLYSRVEQVITSSTRSDPIPDDLYTRPFIIFVDKDDILPSW